MSFTSEMVTAYAAIVVQNMPCSLVVNSQKTQLTIANDIEMLLRKCRTDPVNAQRYTSLVLDIDPKNAEARGYFQSTEKRRKKR